MVDPAEIAAKTAQLLEQDFYSEKGVRKTELLAAPGLSETLGVTLWFKCENLQRTGSFKLRGATSAMMRLDAETRNTGVLTASSGNHGAATALAAGSLGVPLDVYLPESVAAVKEEKIRSKGANIIKVPGPSDRAEKEAARISQETGKPYISPYNHPDILAGQGTIADELVDDLPEIDLVVASVGGGGLLSGIGSRMSQLKAGVDILGCWPENSPALLESLKAGHVVEAQELETLSDGTAGGLDEDSITFPLCQQLLTDTIAVSEAEIAEAMKLILDETGMQVEGAAGVALAGLIKRQATYKGKTAVIILCGGNIEPGRFERAVTSTQAG